MLVTTKVYKVIKLLVIAVRTEKLVGSMLKGALQNKKARINIYINILYVDTYIYVSVCVYL